MAWFVRTTAKVGDDGELPVAISVDGPVSGQELSEALGAVLPSDGDTIYVDDRQLVLDGGPPRETDDGLADGVRLARHPTTPLSEAPASYWEIWVNGGPAAGWYLAAGPGTYLVGRAPDADLRIGDPLVGRRHCRLSIDESGAATVEDLGSRNGTLVDGLPTDGPTALAAGSVIRCGDSLLSVVAAPRELAQLVSSDDEQVMVHRREPVGSGLAADRIGLPSQPEPLEPPSLLADVGVAVAYGATTAGLALVMGSVHMLAFAAISPLVGVFSALIRRQNTRKKERRDQSRYREKFAARVAQLDERRLAEVDELRRCHPGPAEVSRIASIPTRRLWERRPRSGSMCDLRVGSHDPPSAVTSDHEDDPGRLWMAPLTVPLREAGTFGIRGRIDTARAVARSCVVQAVTLHGPDELKVIALLSEEAAERWDFLRWLPHLRGDLDHPALTIAVGRGAIRATLGAIETQLGDRAQLIAAQPSSDGPLTPEYLVVSDAGGALDERSLTLFSGGPPLGLYSVIVDADRLPDGCRARLDLDDDAGTATFEMAGQLPIEDVVVDGLDERRADLSARALTRLRPARRSGHEIPRSVRLLDLIDMAEPTPEDVSSRWRAAREDITARGVRGVVGHDGTGTRELVLSQDVPNMLVAGAPGMGKSEFLLALVAGLATAHGPDEVRFLIIGFKGTQDFNIVERLPHTIGVVGNLDHRSFDRAMRILENEVKRREIVLHQAGYTDIDAYRAAGLAGDDRARRPLPRLVVIVDEFAELKRSSQEQYERLESLTRLGRALGMHLVLATQSPAGVVGGQMEATVPLRLSFKLIGLALSREVIGDPAAGLLPMSAKGRAFMSGQGGDLTELQAARVSARHTPAVTQGAPFLAVYPEHLGRTASPELRPEAGAVEPKPEEKDLWILTDACCGAARLEGHDADAVPWAGPLPDEVILETISEPGAGRLMLGTIDDPDGAIQGRAIHRPFGVELGQGHVALFGASGSGRSTALVTAAIAATTDTPGVHMYGIDNSSGGLAAIAALPSCGGTSHRDHSLARRILDHIWSEVRHRQDLFGSSGAANLAEHRIQSDAPALADIVLLVDRVDELTREARGTDASASAAGTVLASLQKVLAEGAAAGVTVLATFGPTPTPVAMVEHFRHRLILRLSSKDDYSSFGVPSSAVSDDAIEGIPPGRAMLPGGSREVQFAVAGGIERALQRRRIERLRETTPPLAGLTTVRNLPGTVRWDDVDHSPALDALPIAVGDDLAPIVADLAAGVVLLVAGPRRSGRSTALASVCHHLLGLGQKVHVVAPDRSPLAAAVGHGARVSWPLEDEPSAQYREVDVLLIDDADPLVRTRDLVLQKKWVDLLEGGRPRVVVAVSIDSIASSSSALAERLLRADRLVLQPSDRSQAATVLACDRTTAEQFVGDHPPGRGAAVLDGEIHHPIQVPVVSAEATRAGVDR